MLLALLLAAALTTAEPEGEGGPSGSGTAVERGQYLARAGNCVSCHTRENGEPFAGGVAFVTEFGTLYSSNITPDAESGIGGWSEEQFSQAMRAGVGPSGEHLYPVFPYPSFTRLSDADIAALYAFVQTLEPVRYTAPDNELSFPYSQRWALGMWKLLYFEEGRFVPDEQESAQWNRGKYLVKGLAHCGACHTPRTFLGGLDTDSAMTGATIFHRVEGKVLPWAASNLTSAPSGLGLWSEEAIASYLNLGFSERAGVFGPMNEVVGNSTRHLTDQDIRSIATYLKSLPANDQGSGDTADSQTLQAGSLLYDIHCGTCHLPTGLGSDSTGPPLAGSAVALSYDPASLINVTLYGAQTPEIAPSEQWLSRGWKVMGPFAQKLSDDEAAALLSFVRSAWGNKAGAVTPEQVAAQR